MSNNVTSIKNRKRKAASTVANPTARSIAAVVTGVPQASKPSEDSLTAWRIENEAVSNLVTKDVFHGEAAKGAADELIAAVKADSREAVEYVKAVLVKSYLLDKVVEQHDDENGGK